MESQVSGLAIIRLGKSCYECNMHHQNIILQIAHDIVHLSYQISHTIPSYSMRPWNHRLDIRTSQNEGSTHETSTREPSLANIESASSICTYISFHSFIY